MKSLNKSKTVFRVALAAVLAVGIELGLYFSPPEMATLFSDLILGVPLLLTSLIFKVLRMDKFPETGLFFLTLSIPTILYVAIIQTVLSHTWKLKWKYLSCLLVIIFVVLANIGAGKVYLWELTRPQWQTHRYEAFHFSLESPYPLKSDPERTTLVERNNSGKIYIVRQMKASSSVIHLATLTVECKEYAETPPSLEKLKNRWERIVGKSVVQPAVCAGFPAIQLYRSGSNRTLITIKGRFQYYFSFIYSPESHDKGSEMADRVFNSIKIQD